MKWCRSIYLLMTSNYVCPKFSHDRAGNNEDIQETTGIKQMVVEYLTINLSEDSFNHLLIFISKIFKFKRKKSIPTSYVLTILSSLSIKLISSSI